MNNSKERPPIEIFFEPFEPLIVANDRKNFIRQGGCRKPAKFSEKTFYKQCSPTVADEETLDLIQLRRLHEAVGFTESATGSASLLRSLIRPSTELRYIRARQEALEEIASDDRLRRSLEDCVGEFVLAESALFKFFNKGLYALFPYIDIKRARKSAVDIMKAAETVAAPESSYLKALMAQILSYKGSSIDRMMSGPFYNTFGGLKSDGEVGFFTPKAKFASRRFTQWILAGPAVAVSPLVAGNVGFEQAVSPTMTHIGLAWTGLYVLYGMCVKPVRDTERFVEPLRAKCVGDKSFARMIDAFGTIDELLSWDKFARKSVHTAILPKVTDEDRHSFEAIGLKNPVLAKDNPDFVPNDVSMNGARLIFLSGPNSGGKTTICKSVVHNQLLAQTGSYVLAEKATINIADAIRYQAPKFDGLQDDEGRFGTELARTRDIFFSTGPKSLVILDELAEGTTYEERMRESFEILGDFHAIGNNTVLVTHNHSLADKFSEEKKGSCLMAEFDGERPTYRIVPGISRVSHADRIARKIGFSREDRHRYMREKGYVRLPTLSYASNRDKV